MSFYTHGLLPNSEPRHIRLFERSIFVFTSDDAFVSRVLQLGAGHGVGGYSGFGRQRILLVRDERRSTLRTVSFLSPPLSTSLHARS